MDDLLNKLLLHTRFTSNKISRDFLPRRVGLGYLAKPSKLDRRIIKSCLKEKMKNSGVPHAFVSKFCECKDDEDDVNKYSLIKKRHKSSHSNSKKLKHENWV